MISPANRRREVKDLKHKKHVSITGLKVEGAMWQEVWAVWGSRQPVQKQGPQPCSLVGTESCQELA